MCCGSHVSSPSGNYFLHAVSLSPLAQLSEQAHVWDDKRRRKKKENLHCNRESGRVRILSKNVTRLSHEGHNPSKWFFFFLSPTPSCSAPCLLCNVIIFVLRSVTFIKDASAGVTSCQSLGWVLEVYLQCGIAIGELQCSSTDLRIHRPFFSSFFCPVLCLSLLLSCSPLISYLKIAESSCITEVRVNKNDLVRCVKQHKISDPNSPISSRFAHGTPALPSNPQK